MNQLFLANTLTVAKDSLPVFGTPQASLIFALLFTAVLLILYIIVDHLPKPRKNKISAKNEPLFAKIMIVMVSLAMATIGWDVWWHRAVGRDSSFIPPHVFFYSFVTIGFLLAFYVWRHCRDPLWKHAFFTLLFVPISAVFDNYFHSVFGVENYTNPIRLSWSPGHVLLSLSVIATLTLLLGVLLKFRKTPDFNFYGNLCFGGIFVILFVLALPFHPTEGWGQIAGFAGSGVISLLFVFMILSAEKIMKGRMDGSMMTMLSLMFMLIAYGKETAPQIVMLPHDRAPIWLLIFSFLGTAILLDVTKDRFPMWVRGMLAGMIWSGILFGFSINFFATQFQYGMTEIFTAISFSAMGGLVAGSIFGLGHLDNEKHLEKILKEW
ncbi:MAG: hypothetical protein KW802_02090 [Candidatus Doudnabacteria bacterium]|nr:hypothetical protein [Candidatus Doudnabacteria bacterium]